MTPRKGQSLGGRPVTATVTPVNMGNRPHRDNGEGVALASPLPARIAVAGGADARSARHPRSAMPSVARTAQAVPLDSADVDASIPGDVFVFSASKCRWSSVPLTSMQGLSRNLRSENERENGTACAVQFMWGIADRGWRPQRAPPPATAIGPLRGRPGLQRIAASENVETLQALKAASGRQVCLASSTVASLSSYN